MISRNISAFPAGAGARPGQPGRRNDNVRESAPENNQETLDENSIFLIVPALPCGTLAAAQSTPQRSLLALSKRNHRLVIVDPATLQVMGGATLSVLVG